MRKWTFNGEEIEGIKMKYETFQKIGKPKGVFKYKGKNYVHQFGSFDGCYCALVEA